MSFNWFLVSLIDLCILNAGLFVFGIQFAFKSFLMKKSENVCHPTKTGFTLLELMIVVSILAMLAAIALPNVVRARSISQSITCINMLRQLDQAANMFALEKSLPTGATISLESDLTPYLKMNAITSFRTCPSGGIYSCNKVGTSPTCSLGTLVSPVHSLP